MIAIETDRAAGRIAIRGVRYLLIQPATLVGFQQAAAAGGGDPAGWLEAGGRAGGRNSAARLRHLEGGCGRGFAQRYLDMGAEIGWGVFRVTKDEAGRLEVDVNGSPFAEAHGRANGPVCHFIRGVIAGLGDVLFGSCECREIACAAAGAAACQFVCCGKKAPA